MGENCLLVFIFPNNIYWLRQTNKDVYTAPLQELYLSLEF